MNTFRHDRGKSFLGLLAYLGFVVYGSLVPFEMRQVPLDDAISAFAHVQYLNLQAESRADWVANILLYIPLAFLGCNWLVGLRSKGSLRHLSAILILGFCLAVAVAVEFTQIFFAPRTVSLNDLLAETIGSVLGLAAFGIGRWRIADLLDSFARGGRESIIAAAVMYGLVYTFLSLFPFDFVISREEFAAKLSSDNVGWLIAGDCSALLRCSAHQIGESLAMAPLGLLVALAAPRLSYRRLFAVGALIGLLLEALQLPLVSGVSQGLSLLWRGAGLAGGAAVGHFLRHRGPAPLAQIVRLITPWLAIPYLIALAALGGWFSGAWLSFDDALARVPQFRLMPFYYHYWSSETTAMISLLAQAAMYVPVGLVWWGARTGRPQGRSPASWQAAALAAAVASIAEAGKAFVPDHHPDPTNLLIAAAGAAMACQTAKWIQSILTGGMEKSSVGFADGQGHLAAIENRSVPATSDEPQSRSGGWAAAIAMAALFLLLGVVQYPVGRPWLILALTVYGALLWVRPWAFLFVVPALLPLLGLSPFTGRLMIDEFDLLVVVTWGVLLLRTSLAKPRPWPNPWFVAALIMLWASWLVGEARGLWPLLEMRDAIAKGSHSPLEAWLVGKGLLWALLLAPILRRAPTDRLPALRLLFQQGVAAGLAMVSLFVLWERHVFVGVTNFKTEFRATGTFADMHTGGAYIEAFIAFAFPGLAAWALACRRWTTRVAAIAAAGLASYAMMATFSRGGYAGLVAGMVPVTVVLLRRVQFSGRERLVLAGFVAAATVAAVPVLSGEFARYRMARSGEDLSIRTAHWARALDLMDDGPAAALMGMGFGQYPRIYALQGDNERPPGSFIVLREGDNPYLRLGSGESVFLDQILAIEPGEKLKLSVRIRQPYGDASLGVNLCRKTLLHSFECVGERLEPDREGHRWRDLTAELDSMALAVHDDWPYRSIKLSLGNPQAGGLIDVDDVSLKTGNGRELLSNGDFSGDSARWLFVADQDLAWHIHQQEVEMYFAQGFLGLAAMTVLLTAVGKTLRPAITGGDLMAVGFAGSLSGFLTVGLLGSTMDTARLSMLFYLGAFCAALLAPAKPESEGVANPILR